MNNDFINTRDQLFLEQVKTYLTTQSINGAVLTAGEEVPHNVYLGELSDYGSVNVMYVPLPEDHFEDTRLLQFYAPVVSEAEPAKKSDLLALLNEANFICPVGAFTLNGNNEIGFKYVFPVKRFEIMEEQPFLDIFNIYLDCLTTARDAITSLNEGSISLNESITQLRTS